MENKKKMKTDKKKSEVTKKEGKSIRTRRLRSAKEHTNAIREKNSVILDGERSVK